MSPIDQAINELFQELEGQWWLDSLDTRRLDATTEGDTVQGRTTALPGLVTVIIRNSADVCVTARGGTVGSALEEAALVVRARE